jgi:hypothetical protein
VSVPAGPAKPRTPLERQAKSLEDSGRKAAAGWVGDSRVKGAVSALWPDFQSLMDQLGLSEGQFAAGALWILGSRTIRAQGKRLIVGSNPFEGLPEERRVPAQLIAARVRLGIAELADRLRKDDVGLDPVRHVPPSEDRPDGLSFSADHFYLLYLLCCDIPLEGRSGAEIAADLPALPTGSFESIDDVLHVSDHAHERDVRGLYSMRAAWRRQQGQQQLRQPYAGGRARRPVEWQRRARAAIEALLRGDPSLKAIDLHRVWGGEVPVDQLKRGRPGTELWQWFAECARAVDPPAKRWDGWSGKGHEPEAPHPRLATLERYFREARGAISG